jgi:hypothetical protein
MNTKYGQLPDVQCENYKKKLTDKIFKILPLKEHKCLTIDMYIVSLIDELYGVNEIFDDNANFISLIGILERVKEEKCHEVYKQRILQCTNTIIPSLFKEGE